MGSSRSVQRNIGNGIQNEIEVIIISSDDEDEDENNSVSTCNGDWTKELGEVTELIENGVNRFCSGFTEHTFTKQNGSQGQASISPVNSSYNNSIGSSSGRYVSAIPSQSTPVKQSGDNDTSHKNPQSSLIQERDGWTKYKNLLSKIKELENCGKVQTQQIIKLELEAKKRIVKISWLEGNLEASRNTVSRQEVELKKCLRENVTLKHKLDMAERAFINQNNEVIDFRAELESKKIENLSLKGKLNRVNAGVGKVFRALQDVATEISFRNHLNEPSGNESFTNTNNPREIIPASASQSSNQGSESVTVSVGNANVHNGGNRKERETEQVGKEKESFIPSRRSTRIASFTKKPAQNKTKVNSKNGEQTKCMKKVSNKFRCDLCRATFTHHLQLYYHKKSKHIQSRPACKGPLKFRLLKQPPRNAMSQVCKVKTIQTHPDPHEVSGRKVIRTRVKGELMSRRVTTRKIRVPSRYDPPSPYSDQPTRSKIKMTKRPFKKGRKKCAKVTIPGKANLVEYKHPTTKSAPIVPFVKQEPGHSRSYLHNSNNLKNSPASDCKIPCSFPRWSCGLCYQVFLSGRELMFHRQSTHQIGPPRAMVINIRDST